MSHNSTIVSTVALKCPKCHEGNLFVNKNVYQYKRFFDMPNNCPKCNQDFQIETGFYLGAMFVSYGLTIGLNIGIFVAFVIFDAYELVPFLIASGASLIVTVPYITKVSRSIWITLNINYDPKAIENYEA
ncbi:MAG: DUF983 domain-containing protein [Flavobacteriales bacterium]|nr:DUF983 domain-containing protein [Flavobacteriales bacterium]